MGTLRFGKSEQVTCIVDITETAHGEPLCLAYKTSTYWAGAGIYLHDDGYVLRSRAKDGVYYELTPDAREGKVESLPRPFPGYSIPGVEYALGYSLWWILALIALWSFGVHVVRRSRQRKLDDAIRQTPVDVGPPRLDTEGDRFIYNAVAPHLAPGESIQHQAYAVSWDFDGEKAGTEAFFVILTSARIFFVATRIGAFGILFEARGTKVVDRAGVSAAVVAHGDVLFLTIDGGKRGYVVKPQKALSNQTAFLLNVGRLLSATCAPAVMAA